MRYKVLIGFVIGILMIPLVSIGQMLLPDTICEGTSLKQYYVQGWPGSTYTWTVQGGEVVPPLHADVISVNWSGVSPGVYSITVTEHSESGCSGDPLTGWVCIAPSPVVVFQPCFTLATIASGKPFSLRGGRPAGGMYSGTGVTNGYFDPSIAGPGVHTVTYTYTNVYGCFSSQAITITVTNPGSFICGQLFTDTRDGTTYPTIDFGGQCWMAKNLNTGQYIPVQVNQADNCITEKYCYNDSPSNCVLYGGLYQWDELLQYTADESGQGICPPGWHIPSYTEWAALCNFFNGNSLAGSVLFAGGTSGFNALPGGVSYLNNDWRFSGRTTFFWTSTSSGQYRAISHGIDDYDLSVSDYQSLRANAFAVRCILD